MKTNKYEVPTHTLIAQAETTLNQLKSDATAQRREALKDVGINGDAFIDLFKEATQKLIEAERAQESAKAKVSVEAEDDADAAEAGYRYKLGVDARVRTYMANHHEGTRLNTTFRFGKLHSARAKGVIYELRAVIPEMEERKEKLKEVGINDAFINQGKALLATLTQERTESEDAAEARSVATKQVVEAELAISRLLSRLVAADAVIALSSANEAPIFELHVIRTEEARAEAAGEARRIASTPQAFTTS